MSDTTLRKDIGKIIGVITALSLLSIVVVLVLTEQALQKQKQDILTQKMISASALANRFELRIEDATKVVLVASRNDAFAQIGHSDMVRDETKGIPLEAEPEMRKVANDVLQQYGNFETFAIILPNGDVYFVEPYESQTSLPRINFADREWYIGATKTGKPFVAGALISAATGNRIIPIAIPLYDSQFGPSQVLKGIVVVALDMETLEHQLREELNLSDNNRVVFVDNKGNAIQDLSEHKPEPLDEIASFSDLQSAQRVAAGQTGFIIEQVEGVETLTVYRPATMGNSFWGVLVMQPTENAFSTIEYMRNQAYVMLAIIVAITAASGFFLISFRTHSSLAQQLAIANAELIRKDKLKDEFLRIASHELRTPIQPILGYSSLAIRGEVKMDFAWSIVYREAKRLMKLANNILDISMVQSGFIGYRMEETRVADLLRNAIDLIMSNAKAKNLSVEFNPDSRSEDLVIRADPKKLKRVFEELLENAVKFTDSGSIHVECRVLPDTQLMVRMKDTGTAIPPDLLPNLFNIFATKSANDPKVQGAGLGLFLCKAFVEAHKGTIVAENNSDGRGACFEVRIPIALTPREEQEAKAAAT